VCTVDDAHSSWHLINVIDKNRTLLGQFVDYKAIVHDFLADIDGGAKGFEGYLNDVDGAHDTRAESTRLEQQYALVNIC